MSGAVTPVDQLSRSPLDEPVDDLEVVIDLQDAEEDQALDSSLWLG
jgi:hypothetical protein